MQSKGEDAPTESDIREFGLYYACQKSHGNFSLFKDGEYAAKGRVGTSPLYWNRELGIFSFVPGKDLDEFPAGHLYKFLYDHLVCWDPLYFDNPCPTLSTAAFDVQTLIMSSINKYKADAFIMSSGCGSNVIDKFIDPSVTSYTIGTFDSFDVKNVIRPNSVIIEYKGGAPVFLSQNEKPMYLLAKYISENTKHKKLICGLGCTELFRDYESFRPNVNHIVDQFAKFGLEIWSPFFDITVMEYVLDLTYPEDRPDILVDILEDDYYQYGSEIYETTGSPNKKSWYTIINEIVQRWVFQNE